MPPDEEWSSETLESLRSAAEKFIRDGFLAKASAIYWSLARRDPSNIEYQHKLADLYAERGHHSWAEWLRDSGLEVAAERLAALGGGFTELATAAPNSMIEAFRLLDPG